MSMHVSSTFLNEIQALPNRLLSGPFSNEKCPYFKPHFDQSPYTSIGRSIPLKMEWLTKDSSTFRMAEVTSDVQRLFHELETEVGLFLNNYSMNLNERITCLRKINPYLNSIEKRVADCNQLWNGIDDILDIRQASPLYLNLGHAIGSMRLVTSEFGHYFDNHQFRDLLEEVSIKLADVASPHYVAPEGTAILLPGDELDMDEQLDEVIDEIKTLLALLDKSWKTTHNNEPARACTETINKIFEAMARKKLLASETGSFFALVDPVAKMKIKPISGYLDLAIDDSITSLRESQMEVKPRVYSKNFFSRLKDLFNSIIGDSSETDSEEYLTYIYSETW